MQTELTEAPKRLHRRLTAGERQRIEMLRYTDGWTIPQTAAEIGCGPSTVQHHAPGRLGKIPVAPLREAFEASTMSSTDVARALGWMTTRSGERRKPAASRVLVRLGISPTVRPGGGRSWAVLIDAEAAGDISEALGYARWSHGGC